MYKSIVNFFVKVFSYICSIIKQKSYITVEIEKKSFIHIELKFISKITE